MLVMYVYVAPGVSAYQNRVLRSSTKMKDEKKKGTIPPMQLLAHLESLAPGLWYQFCKDFVARVGT